MAVSKTTHLLAASAVLLLGILFGISHAQAQACTDNNTIIANVAAIDQAWVWNRYGAIQPHGMMYALTHDLWILDPSAPQGMRPQTGGDSLEKGKVILRPDKRPRPLTLRVNRGDCLQINFTNLLDPNRRNRFQVITPEPGRCKPGGLDEGCGEQPGDRHAGLHIMGLPLAKSINDDASHVGANPSSLVQPGSSAKYTYIANEEGTYFGYSQSAATGGDGNGGAIFAGLFAAIQVEPAGSVWYRSQLTQREMAQATIGNTLTTSSLSGGQPLLDYSKFAILQGREIRHSDLNAIIDTRTAEIGKAMLCLDTDGKPFPVCGDRQQPFREFTVVFHDESGAVQAFDEFEPCDDENDMSEVCKTRRITSKVLHSVRDGFAINYGTAGAGAEVLANRKGVGPVRNCAECQTEEFFLSSWAVGDPAMVVDLPANLQQQGGPFAGQRATKVFYPDDPSNVYHSYLNDRVVIRNLHAGPKEHHVFHLHAHQWLQTASNPRSSYLDSQTIGPGGGYTYEIAYGGSGNRNRTVGDAIFHCHFYPHFAQGMWALWRVHDVFEAGTLLDKNGFVQPKSRALPDGEIATGTPIPALVPLPGLAMAPVPGQVQIVNGQVDLIDTERHPGYPFFVPALAGHRPPTPPLDIKHDGGLKRHVVQAGSATLPTSPYDHVKQLNSLTPKYLAETGESIEKVAMSYHSTPHLTTYDTSGMQKDFNFNGKAAQPGAPYAEPCEGRSAEKPRIFQIGAFQFDMILTKKGWHNKQSRILALREDIDATMNGDRLPQPLFFRVHSGDCIQVEHTNLVPAVSELDAFQVRTPTDIIGQHIHLVKFDVLASDGGANGFNYEDGTPSPEEVQHRIKAIRHANTCLTPDPRDGTLACPKALPHPWFPTVTKYEGGQITVQRWYADPQEAATTAGRTFDKTLDTVFTHDHFGASTHQQLGLYAGLIVEPAGTRWFDDLTGSGTFTELGRDPTRLDGGPTSWRAVVLSATNPNEIFREFALEFQDFHLAFEKGPTGNPVNPPRQVADGPLLKLVKWECPTAPHCPEMVSSDDVGGMSINYRSEPLSARVLNAAGVAQAVGVQGDLAHMFRTIKRADSDLNHPIQNYPLVGGVAKSSWPMPSPGMKRGDPFTPLVEVYDQEPFKIRLLAGAHEHEHSFQLHGVAWKHMSKEPGSGHRAFLTSALSEHFEIDGLLRIPGALSKKGETLDHIYKVGAAVDDLWYGNWGIVRAYKGPSGIHDSGFMADAVSRGRATHLKYLPSLETVAELAGGPFLEQAKRVTARIETVVDAAQRTIFAQYGRVTSEQLRRFIAGAARLEDQLYAEASELKLSVSTVAAPQTGATVLAPAPGTAERSSSRLMTMARTQPRAGTAVANPPPGGDIPDASIEGYGRALLEAQYEESIETLQVQRIQAASFLETTSNMAPAVPLSRIEFMQNPVSPPPANLRDVPAQLQRFAQLRINLPLLVDFNDPQGVPVCDPNAPARGIWVAAVDAKNALAEKTLVYHRFPPGTTFKPSARVKESWKHVHDPTALLYVRFADLNSFGKLRFDRKIEPLILRANAGDCIHVALSNRIKSVMDKPGYSTLPNLKSGLNLNDLRIPTEVGLHAQLVRKHLRESDGINVGINNAGSVPPGQTVRQTFTRIYRWYAGVLETDATGQPKFVPTEFGTVNLMPADPLKQGQKGLIGAMIIEPEKASWGFDHAHPEPYSGSTALLKTRASAVVFPDGHTRGFRDFVLIGQNDANFRLSGKRSLQRPFPSLSAVERREPDLRATALRLPLAGAFDVPVRRVAMVVECGGSDLCPVADEEVDAVDTGHKAFNYRSEALWMRRVHSAAMPLSKTLLQTNHNLLSDSFNSINAPNQTPRFCAHPGDDVRVRVAFPNGHGRNHVLHVHGHNWTEYPWLNNSTSMGLPLPAMSATRSSQDGVGPGSHWNFLLTGGAGGPAKVAGDYLIRDQYSWGFDNGLWSVMRVGSRCL